MSRQELVDDATYLCVFVVHESTQNIWTYCDKQGKFILLMKEEIKWA